MTPAHSQELKPCAHCGSKAIQAQDGWVHCTGCSIKCGTCIEWNTRHPPTPQGKIAWPEKLSLKGWMRTGHTYARYSGWNKCHNAFMKVIKERGL